VSLTLAFDTSAAHVAACLMDGEHVLAAHEEAMAKGQAEALLPALESLLTSQGRTWQEITALAVGVGPGNFTGIRIAVSAANGLAQGLGIPVTGVSVLEAMAFGHDGIRLASLDARQNRLYLQVVGHSASPPFMSTWDDIPFLNRPKCVGFEAERLAEQFKGEAVAPAHPIAEAIARVASKNPATTPAATPLYIRAADAAKSKTAPPPQLP